MGRFRVGAEVCNNCVHWMCPDDRDFKGNPITDVYTACNCAECRKSHRKTLSDGTCPVFHHIGEVKNTFPYVKKETASTGNAFLQSVMKYKQDLAAIECEKSEPVEQFDEEMDLDGEAEQEFAMTMSELGRANDRAVELVKEGMAREFLFKDKAVEFMHMLDRAKGGDAEAQFAFALAFWNGRHGCEKENSSSWYGNGLHWCNESADNGYCWAQLWKGVRWRNDAVKSNSVKDHEKAVMWLDKALQHSEVREKDRDKNNAYSRSLNSSRITLGVKYLNGKDVAPDFDVAMSYFDAVADDGDSRGDEYKRVAAELREKLRNAVDAWICLSANEDDDVDDSTVGHAFNELGKIYAGYSSYVSYQLVIKKDVQKAVGYFEKAANLGCQDGMDNLGNCYLKGSGVEKNAEKAVMWYRKSAESGWASGQYHYAVCLRNGEGVDKDEREALKWLMKAGANGHVRSLNMLGMCAKGGCGMAEDPELAFEWYKLAAESGDAESMYELGWLYHIGYGCEGNEALRNEWQDKARQNGYSGEW